MIFGFFGINSKTVKQLRRKQGLTAQELAQMSKVDTIKILKVDDMKLKDVPKPLKEKIAPFLQGNKLKKAMR